MDKYIVLIDMDGVVCTWVKSAIETYNDRYPGANLDISDCHEYDIRKMVPEDKADKLVGITREFGFYSRLGFVEGAQDALEDIEENCSEFIEPFLCSSPDNSCEVYGSSHGEKAQWVKSNLSPWWHNRLILTHDKTLIRGHFLIDDKGDIQGVMKPVWTKFLYKKPYNRDNTEDMEFTWKDWSAFSESLKNAFYENSTQMKKMSSSKILITSSGYNLAR